MVIPIECTKPRSDMGIKLVRERSPTSPDIVIPTYRFGWSMNFFKLLSLVFINFSKEEVSFDYPAEDNSGQTWLPFSQLRPLHKPSDSCLRVTQLNMISFTQISPQRTIQTDSPLLYSLLAVSRFRIQRIGRVTTAGSPTIVPPTEI